MRRSADSREQVHGSHGGGPERAIDGQRGAAQGRCGGASTAALDPVVAKDALLVSRQCGASKAHLDAAALDGKTLFEALKPHDGGTEVRGDLHVQTVNSLTHSRNLKDFNCVPSRGIATRYLGQLT